MLTKWPKEAGWKQSMVHYFSGEGVAISELIIMESALEEGPRIFILSELHAEYLDRLQTFGLSRNSVKG